MTGTAKADIQLASGGAVLAGLESTLKSNLCTEDTHCNYFFRVPLHLIIFNDCGKSDTLKKSTDAPEKRGFWPDIFERNVCASSTQLCEWS